MSHVPVSLSNRGAAFSASARPAMPRAGRTSASARCPMHRVDCVGGFAFPFVGIFSKQNVLVQAGHSPAQAWEAYHRGEERLSILDIANVRSGLMVLDILPIHAHRLMDEIAAPRTTRAVRARRTSGSPGGTGIRGAGSGGNPPLSSAREARGRALWFWLGAVEAGYPFLPCPCQSCGCPSLLRCHACRRTCIHC